MSSAVCLPVTCDGNHACACAALFNYLFHRFSPPAGSQTASLVFYIVLSKDKSGFLSPESLAFSCKWRKQLRCCLPQWDAIMLLRILSLPAAVVYLLPDAPQNVSLQHWSNSCRQGSPSQEKRQSQNIADTKGTASFLLSSYLHLLFIRHLWRIAAAPMCVLLTYYTRTPKVLILLAD